MKKKVNILDFVALVRAWNEAFGKDLVTAREALRAALTNPKLESALEAVFGKEGLATPYRLYEGLDSLEPAPVGAKRRPDPAERDGEMTFLDKWAYDFYLCTGQGWQDWWTNLSPEEVDRWGVRGWRVHGWYFLGINISPSFRYIQLVPGSLEELDWIERTVPTFQRQPEQSSASL